MDHNSKKLIEKLLDKSQDDILFLLGKELLQSSKHSMPFGQEQIIKLAKNWLDKNITKLSEVICGKDIIKKYTKDSDKKIETISAIIDLISSISIGVSPVTVAVLITKYGIKEICKEENNGKR